MNINTTILLVLLRNIYDICAEATRARYMGPNGLRQIGNYLELSAGHLDLDESEMEQYYLTIYNKLIQDGKITKLELKFIK